MMRIHLMPDTPADGPAWSCAEIRLLRPYRHRSICGRTEVSTGRILPSSRIDVLVLQRGGPVGISRGDLHELIRLTQARGIRLVVDIDDDLLAQHPVLEVDTHLDQVRPNVRFLLREADLVTVSTPALANRLHHLNPRIAVWRNALDEAIVPDIGKRDGADVGYFGTYSHLPDFLAVTASLERATWRAGRRLGFEFCGISHDSRLRLMLQHSFDVTLRGPEGQYEQFHAMLAHKAAWKVGLAPLPRGEFNDRKSDIKILDYTAAGIACIVSDSPVYEAWTDGETVLRACEKEFGQAAVRLAEDDALRRRLVGAAREELFSHRVLSATAAQLIDLVEDCLG